MSSLEAHHDTEHETLHYNAFISYKHVSPDMDVARRLHTILENYQIPKKLQESSGIRKIDRIFRDREELNVSADLGKNIETALLHSDYLILICSPESKASEWVQREVAFFLKHHPVENVLTVLVRGEPETAFPQAICQREKWVEVEGEQKKILETVEPLAADVRADSLPETIKLLKEESLRILAGILQCPYDTLKQRHREKRLRRIMYSAFAVAALALAFMGFALHSRQQINSQYQEARKNLARSLSAKARDEIKEGDRKKAMLLALAVENDRDPDRALVPEQISVLHEAMGTYSFGNHYISEYGQAEGMLHGYVSEDKKSILIIDGFSNLILMDGISGKIIWKMGHEDFEVMEEDIDATWSNVCFADNDRALVWSSRDLLFMDVKKKKVLYRISGSFGNEINHLSIHRKAGQFCFYQQDSSTQDYGDAYDSYLTIYNLETGDQLLNYKIDELHTENKRITVNNILYDLQGRKIYLSVSDQEGIKGLPGLMSVSVDDRKTSVISRKECLRAYVTKKDELICFFKEDTKDLAGEGQIGDNPGCHLTLFDKKGKESWTSSSFITSDHPDMWEDRLETNKGSCRVLYAWCRNELLILNLDEQKIMKVFPSYSAIRGACTHKNKNRILIAFTNGSVLAVDADDFKNRMEVLSLDNDIRDFYYNKEADEIIQINSGGNFIFSQRNRDEEMKEMSMNSVPKESNYIFYYAEAGGRSWPYIITSDMEDVTREKELIIFSPDTRKPIYTFSLEKEGVQSINNLTFGMQGSDLCMAFLMDTVDNTTILYKINVTDQKVLIKENLSTYETLSFYSFAISEDLTKLACKRTLGGVVIFDLTGRKATPEDRAIWSKRTGVDKMYFSCKGDYMLASITQETAEGYQRFLSIYNLEKEKYLKKIYYGQGWSGKILAGRESNRVALYDGANHIAVYNLETGEEINSFDVEISDSDGINLAFFDKDRFIITWDHNNVSMWSVASGRRTMSYEYEEGQWVEDSIRISAGSPYFSLKANENITSFSEEDASRMSRRDLHIFYVDRDHRFYPVCQMNKGVFGIQSGEITVVADVDQVYYAPLYSFAALKKRAIKQLDGKQLSDAERKEYFVSGE